MMMVRIRNRILLLVFLCICFHSVAFAGAHFTGEKIEANPEAMRSEYEQYVFKVMQTLAQYATDDVSASAMRRYTLPDSPAEIVVNHYDGGWFTAHRSVSFENGISENYSGDGTSAFSCDVYMDCVVHVSKDKTVVYDMAYRFDFICPDSTSKSENKWKLKRFTNLYTEPDRVDLVSLNAQDDGLTVEHVIGPTFKGYILTVTDPSRVCVGTIARPFDADKYGWQLDQFAQAYNASAVINGGGFSDRNGMGKGGKPNGIVVSEGEWLQNPSGGRTFGTIIGFDTDDRLIVRSELSTEEAKQLSLRDAVGFSPALIIDGKAVDNGDYRTELSARSAIGQRADGAVLMLVVDGRQPDSFGSDMTAMTDILLEHGAVNAANLDGGTSTALILHGQKVNDGSASSQVSRNMPTAFIVR